jgi:acetyl-CoA synthetase
MLRPACRWDKPALIWEDRDGNGAALQFEQLQGGRALRQCAQGARCGGGDRVAGLMPRTPELLVTILATWRLGAVYQPLFTAFGPKAIEHRLNSRKPGWWSPTQ